MSWVAGVVIERHHHPKVVTVKESSLPLTLLTVDWHNCTTVGAMIIAKSFCSSSVNPTLRHLAFPLAITPHLTSFPSALPLCWNIFTFDPICWGLWRGCGWFCKKISLYPSKHGNRVSRDIKVDFRQFIPTNALLTPPWPFVSEEVIKRMPPAEPSSPSLVAIFSKLSPPWDLSPLCFKMEEQSEGGLFSLVKAI